MRDCKDLLHRFAPRTTFECGRIGTLAWHDFRVVHQRATGIDRSTVELAKPNVPKDLLIELTDVLHDLLREHVVDASFGNRLAYIFGGIPTFGITEFALNTVRAAAILGPERATQWLYKWASGEPVQYQLCAVISGLTVEQSLDIEGGIRFITLPTSTADLDLHLPGVNNLHFGLSSLMKALKVTVDCKAGPAVCKPEEVELSPPDRTWHYGHFPIDPIATICEALSLACNCHVSWVMQWSDGSEEIKAFGLVFGSSWSGSSKNPFPLASTMMLEKHLQDIRNLLMKRIEGKGGGKNLDMAIRRWIGSKDRKNYEDQFIDLRIALEALYLPGMYNELGFRLATHGAWHLGSDFHERRYYYKILREAYQLGSRAVHASGVESSEKNRKLLTDAQDLCRKGILKRLSEGRDPNWNELILGKESEASP